MKYIRKKCINIDIVKNIFLYFILRYMIIRKIFKGLVLFEWRREMIIVVNIYIFKNSVILFCILILVYFFVIISNIEYVIMIGFLIRGGRR